MKHHLYQIYYGGMKQKLLGQYLCKTCNKIVTKKAHKLAAALLVNGFSNDK